MKYALIACMDEALCFGNDILWVGLGGTLATIDGASDGFPQKKRQLVEEIRPEIVNTLKEICQKMGTTLAATSHQSCGWLALQGVKEDPAITDLTKKLSQELGAPYKGHIAFAKEPQSIDDVSACILRSPEEHHHWAEGIILTTGGFINQPEYDQICQERNWRGAFVISKEWLSKLSSTSQKKGQQLIDFEIALANKIMGRTVDNPLPIFEFNAGRLTV